MVAILDERASEGKRYSKDVLAALPQMPVTSSLEDVARFIRSSTLPGLALNCSVVWIALRPMVNRG